MTYVAAIVGSTAVGKTALSIEIAATLDAEIVSLDSMQLYRGMDVGTDKVDAATRERVPHHLIDVFDPAHEVTVAEFQKLARDTIEDITGRGKVPLLVGGSGLYFRAVVDPLEFPPQVPAVRGRLEDEVETLGTEVLHARLAEMDPAAAGKIEPSNARRIVRALEVIEVTGRPFSTNDSWDRYESIYDLRVVGITRPREELYDRIERRVRSMLEAGLVEEAHRIEAAGMGRTGRMALGYRQVLDAPGASAEELTSEIVRATKRFARRQESWFRADPRVRWVDVTGEDAAAQALDGLGPKRVTGPGGP